MRSLIDNKVINFLLVLFLCLLGYGYAMAVLTAEMEGSMMDLRTLTILHKDGQRVLHDIPIRDFDGELRVVFEHSFRTKRTFTMHLLIDYEPVNFSIQGGDFELSYTFALSPDQPVDLTVTVGDPREHVRADERSTIDFVMVTTFNDTEDDVMIPIRAQRTQRYFLHSFSGKGKPVMRTPSPYSPSDPHASYDLTILPRGGGEDIPASNHILHGEGPLHLTIQSYTNPEQYVTFMFVDDELYKLGSESYGIYWVAFTEGYYALDTAIEASWTPQMEHLIYAVSLPIPTEANELSLYYQTYAQSSQPYTLVQSSH